MKVLVVDDDPTSRLIAQTAVESLGHDCVTACDGAQGWDALKSDQPDVVISDWMMPELTGIELFRTIRDGASDAYAYLILLTIESKLYKAIEGMRAGADDYLIKPLDPDALRIRLIAAARVTALHDQLALQRTELEALNLTLTSMSLLDPLTGLGNRRALEEEFEQLEARVARYGHRYCIAMLDIDNFKAFNDIYGHQAGDQALRDVAGQLRAEARKGDALYRYGGEEFLCILPEHSIPGGAIAVERMRVGVQSFAIPHSGNAEGILTISAGLSVLYPGDTRPVVEVLKEADDALYRAKALGRNRVEGLAC
ncbi:MAG TPA: diguanylate cyclase [Acidothermaceae bacterium]